MHRTLVVVFAALTFIFTLTIGSIVAHAQTFSVLYDFGTNPGDPNELVTPGDIAQGRDGNFYSTSFGGGGAHQGTVFQITPGGVLTVIYSFDGTHGASPLSGLTLGTDGDFYGTTELGGANNDGEVFKITPAGLLTVLHSFAGVTDGFAPAGPPIQAPDGNWYGTTAAGGLGNGTIYKLTPSGVFTLLHQFTTTEGAFAQSGLIQAADGNLYGTTAYAGADNSGTVFKVSPTGDFTVLYTFDGPHGSNPYGALIQASNGNFYGTTVFGGAKNRGVIFQLTSAGTLTVLHSFAGDRTDRGRPYAALVQASDRSLYGVTNGGTLFRIGLSGANYSVLHTFDGTAGNPTSDLLQSTNGTFYGDTASGGTKQQGVFYELSDSLPAFIRALPHAGKVGSKIGILGQGFSASSVVKFNGVTATTTTLRGTTFILATVPAGASNGYITVTTGSTTLKSLKKFVVHNSWN